jgi:hypothetical protein
VEGKPEDNVIARKAVLYRRTHSLPAFLCWEVVREALKVVAEAVENHPGVTGFECSGFRVLSLVFSV